MPIYEYACESCNERFEIKQKFTDNPLTVCPRCSGSIHRVIQPTRVVFKGSGFYVTDHNKSSVQSAKSDTKPAAESSEAKPAAGESSTPAAAPAKTETAKPEPSVAS